MLHRRTFLSLLTGTVAAATLPACRRVDPNVDFDGQPFTLTKGPWVHVIDESTVSLRFESREDVEVQVTLQADGERYSVVTERTAAQVGLPWGLESSGNPLDDEGLHVLHEVIISDIAPGTDLLWHVQPAADQIVEGTFRAPPTAAQGTRIGWIADTMYPNCARVAAMLATHDPELVVHGGDLQYRTNPADTWNGFFLAMAPLFSTAAAQICFGNHELDEDDEAEHYFDRLFVGQGGSDTPRYHAIPWGRLLIVCLDSETGDLADPDSAQRQWLRATLEHDSLSGRTPILAFHRPTYSLSKYAPRDLQVRDAVHAIAVDFGCPLVLCGHVHGYERFTVGPVTYVIDGGGGALLTNLDERAEEIAQSRPGETELRQADSRTYGATLLTVDGGTLRIERFDTDGERIDSADLAL